MKYLMLKDVCKISMGQSPNSSSYNDNGDGVPFFQGNADFGKDILLQGNGVTNQLKWLIQKIY